MGIKIPSTATSQLRYVVTIHKSQGQTLNKAVIDLGKSEISAGSTFVAVSHLHKLEDGLFQPMTFDRLKKIGQSKRFGERKTEEARLHQLWSTTQSCIHHPSSLLSACIAFVIYLTVYHVNHSNFNYNYNHYVNYINLHYLIIIMHWKNTQITTTITITVDQYSSNLAFNNA